MDEIDYGSLYRQTREAMCSFVTGLDDGQLAVRLPAVPEWTARDAIAHVTGICTDILSGNLADVGSDAWTAAQVVARRGADVASIVAEWSEVSPQIEAMAGAAGPEMASLLISDLVTHDLDVRGAFGDTSARSSPATALVYDFYATNLGTRLDGIGAPALRVIADRSEGIVGSGEPAATVRASRFELIRALSGRRSAGQIRAYDWDGDSEPYVEAFAEYPMRGTPLNE
ncbi:MAG: maleylpyruvate isomerase family mycothiol-dependent enzyme [Acidimicrobiia bacterium]|nr:maleylpyruvate isomerase family mycothiol-dependent enzyme [Acidimicrobiia bacterium]